ncbi:signal peptidase II [Novosphingobium sp.]|uniref:signal peptidase II n=1 Tax=Novosphingobium sp. TaxID=1874826 RepID=UPI0027340A6A|nr:signal peptidase II [Novosphingobium sp.]MDP3906185.1 signal peptidase II [Novosphingobium sp.]
MTNSVTIWRNRLIGLLLAAVIFVVDQWFKAQVLNTIKLPQVRSIEIVSFFNLTYAENYGISLGMLTATSMEMRWMLIAVTSGIALVVFIWILREKLLGETAALGLVLGGALGNILDRMNHGFVIDYADLHFGEFRPFLIFNLADAAITIGVVIILARSFLSREKHDEPAQRATES